MIAKQICQAIAYLHALQPPIVHQDIKPSHILIDSMTYIVKLCDLGISRVKSLNNATVTSQGLPGTVMYMAPEMILRGKSCLSSDIWALGCTLLELYTLDDTWDLPVNVSPTEYITSQLSDGKLPPRVSQLPHTRLVDCFATNTEKRPKAMELISLF